MITQKTDEIDLGELLVNIKKSVVKRKWLIIILTIAGMILGITKYTISPVVYRSEMVAYSEVLEETLILTIDENLKKIFSDRNLKYIAERFSLPDSVAKSISSIKIDLQEKQKNKDGLYFNIKVNSKSNNNFDIINPGIIKYLSSNEYVNKRVILQKEHHQKLIDKLDNEIGLIDSLKNNISGLEKNQKLTVLDPSAIYETLIGLYKDQLRTNSKLDLSNGVEIIDTIDYSRPVSAGLLKSAVVGFGIGLIISFMIVFLLEVSSYIKQYEKQ